MFTDNITAYVNNTLPSFDGNYLEIGVYDGKSIATLANNFSNKMIYAIDPFIEDGNTTWHSGVVTGNELKSQRDSTYNFIKDAKNIQLFEMTSKEFYSSLTIENVIDYNIQIVFIDGAHQYDHVVNDYLLALKLLNNKNGIIIFDDTHITDVISGIENFKLHISHMASHYVDLGSNSCSYEIKAI